MEFNVLDTIAYILGERNTVNQHFQRVDDLVKNIEAFKAPDVEAVFRNHGIAGQVDLGDEGTDDILLLDDQNTNESLVEEIRILGDDEDLNIIFFEAGPESTNLDINLIEEDARESKTGDEGEQLASIIEEPDEEILTIDLDEPIESDAESSNEETLNNAIQLELEEIALDRDADFQRAYNQLTTHINKGFEYSDDLNTRINNLDRDFRRQFNMIKSNFHHQMEDINNRVDVLNNDHINNINALQQQRDSAQRQLANAQQQVQNMERNDRKLKIQLSVGTVLFLVILAVIVYFLNTPEVILGGIITGVVVVVGVLTYYFVRRRNLPAQRVPILQQTIQNLTVQIHAANQQYYQSHASLVNESRDANAATRRQLDELFQNSTSQHSVLNNDLRNTLRQLGNHFVPEAKEVLNSWLKMVSTDLNNDYPEWNSQVRTALDVMIARAQDQQELIGFRVGNLAYNESVCIIPAILDFITQKKHVFLRGDNQEEVQRRLKKLITQLVAGMPVGHGRFVMLDGLRQASALAQFTSELGTSKEERSIKNLTLTDREVFDDQQEMLTRLKEIREEISHRNHHILIKFDSIDEHNQAHPEVPSPYYFVAIENFPHGFNDQSLSIFKEILRNGPKAGIYVIASIFEPMPKIHDFKIDDYLSDQYLLEFLSDGYVKWNSVPLGFYKVNKEMIPNEDLIGEVLVEVKKLADTKQFVVGYERIHEKLSSIWSGDTRNKIDIPVGLSIDGSIQEISFSDNLVHALVGGQTGSGKTHFLHVLITTLAHKYSPEELELHLLDFAGTAFNIYAKEKLAIAKTIAVDCDPEVGLSVIDNIQKEMNRRRDLFFENNVEDIRQSRGKGIHLPRILIIIDEIQVMLQDDTSKITRDVEAKIIDILKRGRKFGIHMLIATQSTRGALSATILEQIAIRICFRADQGVSRLVLGQDNEAAARLTQQGEGVYNSNFGITQYNKFFKGAFLGDDNEKIRLILQEVKQHGDDKGLQDTSSQLFFDGRMKKSITANEKLEQVLSGKSLGPSIPSAMLGISVEIKQDTQVEFSRNRFSNLLVVGTNLNRTHDLMLNTLLSLVLTTPVERTKFFVIDLSAAYSEELYNLTRSFKATMPHEFQFGKNSTLGLEIIEDLYNKLLAREERIRQGDTGDDYHFLFVMNMENFADMRGPDKYSKTEGRKMFEKILQDGPITGFHTVASTQTMSKGAILEPGEFGNKVCFQVAEEESRDLLNGNDAASKLERPDRALYNFRDWPYQKVEKFIPYMTLDEEVIQSVAKMLTNKEET